MSPFTSRVRTISSTLRPATLALAALALLTTGCANFNDAVSGTTSATPAASLSGNVHGGRQPVVGAVVSVWAAGLAGYGSAATRLAITTTDANGNFTFAPGSGNTYACPASNSGIASQLIYLTSSGGQPTTGITNSTASFLLALGDCSTVLSTQPFVNINEVTTIGSMFALQQFFSPTTEAIGTNATNVQGLKNAFATVNNLVNVNTGTANTTLTVSGPVTGYATNPSVTVTPESSKINTLADTLAACVNTNGSTAPVNGTATACGTLFSSVNSTAATNTLDAAYYLATNPTSTVSGTSNIASIYALATATSPYQPTLTAAPTDWTIGVTYGSSSSQPITTGTTTASTYLLTEPEYLAVDSTGNIWVANFGTTSATASGNSVTEISPTGTPLLQTLTTAGQIAGPRNLIIDPSNNVYVASYGTTANSFGKVLAEYTSAGAIKTFAIGSGPDGLLSDGVGNIFIATSSSTGGSADLEYLPNNSASGTTSTVLAAANAGTYSSMAIDSYNNLWLSNNASTGVTQFICTFTGTPSCTGTATTAGGQTGSQSISVDHSNNIWIGNYSSTAGGGSASVIAATNSATITGLSGSPFSGGGLTNPTRSTFDGLGNYWVTNYATKAGQVTELTGAGVAISPSTGFAHTFSGAEAIAIDGSGNVWVGNSGAAATATVNGYLTEIVGAAGPAITPYAKNLPTIGNTTNTIGTRP